VSDTHTHVCWDCREFVTPEDDDGDCPLCFNRAVINPLVARVARQQDCLRGEHRLPAGEDQVAGYNECIYLCGHGEYL
jgi:hypothetical protein